MRYLPFIAVLLCAILVTSAARAADDLWRFSITPYLWLPSANTKTATDDEPDSVQSDTENILSKLDFALMGTGEIAKGKVGLFFDSDVVKFRDDGKVQIVQQRDFDRTLTIAQGTVAGEYRVVDDAKCSIDALAGARVIYAKTAIDINSTTLLPDLKSDQSKIWVDPIVGLKLRYRFNDKWGVNAYGDIGGFGVSSTLTYQAIASVSYSFTDHIALQVGYRLFSDDYHNGDFKFDAKLYGPIVGLTFSF
jgi:hypothetical protein